MQDDAAIAVLEAEWERDGAFIRAVRTAVFLTEQGIAHELDFDGRDADCAHVLALAPGGEPVGTGRVERDGHIGRVAVLAPWRGMVTRGGRRGRGDPAPTTDGTCNVPVASIGHQSSCRGAVIAPRYRAHGDGCR